MRSGRVATLLAVLGCHGGRLIDDGRLDDHHLDAARPGTPADAPSCEAVGGPCDGPDTDDCDEGIWVCDGAGLVSCGDASEDSPEVCGNQLDDDCDGEVDEPSLCCAEMTDLQYNGGLEIVTAGTPAEWGSEGTVAHTFSAQGGDPHAGSRYGRLQTDAPSGTIWMSTPVVPVEGAATVVVDAYLRSNMRAIRARLVEYDAAGNLLRYTDGPAYDAGPWRWDRYRDAAGELTVSLGADARQVVVALIADVEGAPAYLDVDDLTVRAARPEQRFGVHSALEYQETAEILPHIALIDGALEPQISRNGVNWWMIEPTRGSFDWSRTDALVEGLTEAGITPLLPFVGSPSWANGSDDWFVVPTTEPAFSQWVADYVAFVRTTVRRYGAKVKHWELWNEPNLDNFWRPAPDIGRYAAWAAAVGAAIEEEDPSALVAYGSVTIPDLVYLEGQQISGKAFLQGLYDRGLVPEIVSAHPYAMLNEPARQHAVGDGLNTFRDVEILREVMLANGPASSKMWLTEFGWQVGTPYGDVTVTDDLQNQRMIEALDVARRWPYVSMVIWFWDWDRMGAFAGFGLLDSATTRRPAGLTFKEHVELVCQ